jgi:hypothetical protein
MAYGHAERALDAIRQLEAETAELLSAQPDLDPEQEQWLREEARPGCRACGVPAQQRPAGRPCRPAMPTSAPRAAV